MTGMSALGGLLLAAIMSAMISADSAIDEYRNFEAHMYILYTQIDELTPPMWTFRCALTAVGGQLYTAQHCVEKAIISRLRVTPLTGACREGGDRHSVGLSGARVAGADLVRLELLTSLPTSVQPVQVSPETPLIVLSPNRASCKVDLITILPAMATECSAGLAAVDRSFDPKKETCGRDGSRSDRHLCQGDSGAGLYRASRASLIPLATVTWGRSCGRNSLAAFATLPRGN